MCASALSVSRQTMRQLRNIDWLFATLSSVPQNVFNRHHPYPIGEWQTTVTWIFDINMPLHFPPFAQRSDHIRSYLSSYMDISLQTVSSAGCVTGNHYSKGRICTSLFVTLLLKTVNRPRIYMYNGTGCTSQRICVPLWTVSALLQVIACRLFGAKPLPELMQTY